MTLEIDNDIPIGKGLGSSAAALTAGVVMADHLLGLHWKPLRILDEAARIEGHPDNVAACVLGSIVASAMESGGVARAVRLHLPARYGVGIVVPDFILPTSEARAVLPDFYSREDTVFNVQRSALLIGVLSGAGPSVLVFYEKGCEQVCDLVRQIFAFHGHESDVLWAHIAEGGYEVEF